MQHVLIFEEALFEGMHEKLQEKNAPAAVKLRGGFELHGGRDFKLSSTRSFICTSRC